MEGLNFFDAAIMGFVQAHFHNPVTDTIFQAITFLGDFAWAFVVLFVVLLFVKKWRTTTILLIVAIGLTLIVGEGILKNSICRPRPFQTYPDFTPLIVPAPAGFSFPSGHSASPFAVATVLLFFHKRFGIVALIIASVIAFSRVFVFVHYPTDILAGAVLGTLIALSTVFVYRKIQKKRGTTSNIRQ